MPEPHDPKTEEDSATIRFAENWLRYMQNSPFYLSGPDSREHSDPPKFERYSDKYMTDQLAGDCKGKILAIDTCLSFFPEELHSIYNVERAQRVAKKLGGMSSRTRLGATFDETLAKLRSLEHRDQEEGKATSEGEEDNEDKVVYEEEELEDETDYNLNYFDNGEDYGDYDDGDDGPVY